jgi:hypothetical protein
MCLLQIVLQVTLKKNLKLGMCLRIKMNWGTALQLIFVPMLLILYRKRESFLMAILDI